ncbi:hypothetical protein CUT44_14300 [Streptomyces carminius]|uniref:Uncharacterized protein n=1 Tax=Streptomyces carminius TaxID=2665496 RepID=A0A2M8LYU0_9ACTN|nr:hypothetical protein [Streptomyces carminius]PJE97148.1 hypothetical protein CUT44_14300 [Streptomyces carminius]
MLARVRAQAGRVATITGSAVLTGGLFTDSLTLPGALAAVATAGVGLATNAKILRAPESVKATAIAVYAAPHAGCGAVLVGERLAPAGVTSVLVQAGAVALWTGATWLLRPGLVARELVGEATVQEIAEVNGKGAETAEVAVPDQPEHASPAARWWAEEIATEDGIAPDTVLLEHQQVSERCVALIIGSSRHGMPVPEISTARLSAYLDMSEDLIEIGPVPGRGAGVRLLVIGPRPQPVEPEAKAAGTDEETWAEIAATAMPGVELIETNTYDLRKEPI